MVGVEYTGTDGKTTSFGSESAAYAIRRLSGIAGYSANGSDGLAAQLASTWREKFGGRPSEIVRGERNDVRNFGKQYATGRGVASEAGSVTDIEIVGGRLVKSSQTRYVDGNGKTVGFGNRKTEDLGDLGIGELKKSMETLGETARKAAEDAKKALESRATGNAVAGAEDTYVSDIKFSVKDGLLAIDVVRRRGKFISFGKEETESMTIGRKIPVHEAGNANAHSMVGVISAEKISKDAAAAFSAKDADMGEL